ncbi:MAG: FimB/Mfa2 family fimbrial subunit [Alistipes sp.]|nr:FimB/Mfa2 family fimbrial subunit [Alistipes sp.]
MKFPYTALKLTVILLCAASVLQSCIKDDRDDCPDSQPAVRIVVRTLAETTRSEADLYNIENVYIYIFDADLRYVATWQGGAYSYGTEYEAWLDLEPGTYHFVAWTNQGMSYAGQPDGDAGSLVVGLQYPAGGVVDTEIPDLHHGMLADAEVLPETDHTFEIIIRPDTYRINFTVEGLEAFDEDEYLFSVTDNNTHYGFDNTIIEGMDHVRYLRTTGFTDGGLTASVKTLRLTEGREPLFELADITSGQTLYTDNLVEMILSAYAAAGHTVDFETEFEFDLRLVFDADMNLTISVDGWNYNPGPTPLG